MLRVCVGILALAEIVVSSKSVLDLHSFTQQTSLNVFTSRWSNFGTSVPLKSHIILSPSVSDRWGAQFHKHPLLTDTFEVKFSLNLKKSTTAMPAQSFALWYVKENVTAAIPHELASAGAQVGDILKQTGFSFAGYRGRFEGVGIVFSYLPRPTISVAVNDGSREFRSADLPLSDSAAFDFRKNPRVEIRLLFEKAKVTVFVRENGNSAWSEIVSAKFPGLAAGGYLGLTGVVEKDERLTGTADVVMIDDFIVENLDLSQKGEEAISVSAQVTADDNLLGDHGEVADHKALKILTRNIYRLISETEKPRHATLNAVKTINSRLDAIDKSIENLKMELNALAGGDLEKHLTNMKDELLQISKATASSKVAKQSKMDKLMAGRREDQPAAKASKLKDKLTGSGSFLLTLLAIALLGMCAVGLMMWLKVGKWEKKHIL